MSQTGSSYVELVWRRYVMRSRNVGGSEVLIALLRTKQQLAEVQTQYIAVTNTAEPLTEYQDGLLPQAQAAFRAEQTTYRAFVAHFSYLRGLPQTSGGSLI